jgi:hypothetical protein
MMGILRVIFGGFLLVFGKKIFWLFVGLCGFAFGIALASSLFEPRSEWVALALGLVLGVLGAVVASQVPRIAIVLAGFLGGALVAASLGSWLDITGGILTWVLIIVGGILGVLVLRAVFDWGLIGISSLAGAAMVVDGLQLSKSVGGWVLIGLFVVGVVVQAVWMRSEKH